MHELIYSICRCWLDSLVYWRMRNSRASFQFMPYFFFLSLFENVKKFTDFLFARLFQLFCEKVILLFFNVKTNGNSLNFPFNVDLFHRFNFFSHFHISPWNILFYSKFHSLITHCFFFSFFFLFLVLFEHTTKLTFSFSNKQIEEKR